MLNGSAAVDHKDSVPNGGRNVLLRPPRNGSSQRHRLVPLTFYHEFSFGHYHRLINDPYLWLGTGRNEERAGATNFGQLVVLQGQFRDLDLNIGKVDRRDLAVTATRDNIFGHPIDLSRATRPQRQSSAYTVGVKLIRLITDIPLPERWIATAQRSSEEMAV